MRARLLTAVLLAGLAGCTYYWRADQEEANIIAPSNFRAGSGQIYQVGVLPYANKAKDAKDPNLYRLYLRMDVSGTQSVDVDRSHFMAGEAVELTSDGRVVRVSGTTMNDATRR